MRRRTVSVGLLIIGVLVFACCGIQISNLPPKWVTPGELFRKYQGIASAYRIGQVIAATVAVVGGVGLVKRL